MFPFSTSFITHRFLCHFLHTAKTDGKSPPVNGDSHFRHRLPSICHPSLMSAAWREQQKGTRVYNAVATNSNKNHTLRRRFSLGTFTPLSLPTKPYQLPSPVVGLLVLPVLSVLLSNLNVPQMLFISGCLNFKWLGICALAGQHSVISLPAHRSRGSANVLPSVEAIVDASGAKTIRIMCQPPCGSGNLPPERNRAILAIFHVLTFAVGPFGAPLARVCTRHLSCSHLQCALFFGFVCLFPVPSLHPLQRLCLPYLIRSRGH